MSNLRLLTDELQDELCKYLQSGATIADACAMVGLAESTYYRWCQWGEAHDKGEKLPDTPHKIVDRERCLEFLEAVKKARSRARVANVAIILKAAKNNNWQAAAWFLERSNPKEWARRTYAKIEGLDELLQAAARLNIPASDLFNAMLAELTSVENSPTDSV